MFEKCARTLRVSPEATPEEVRQAFVKLARRYPPEHFPKKFVVFKECADIMNLDEEAIQKWVGKEMVRSAADVFSMLFSGVDQGALRGGASPDALPELNLAVFFRLLDQEQLRQDIQGCLDNVQDGESFYRR